MPRYISLGPLIPPLPVIQIIQTSEMTWWSLDRNLANEVVSWPSHKEMRTRVCSADPVYAYCPKPCVDRRSCVAADILLRAICEQARRFTRNSCWNQGNHEAPPSCGPHWSISKQPCSIQSLICMQLDI